MAEILQNLYQEYKNAVSSNSAVIAQFESAFRLVSYVIAGRFQDSTILSELLYSASNILVLCNDAIVKKTAGILPKVPTSFVRLQNIITVLEYVGVFIEITAERLYGEVGRWIAVSVLQIAKSVCRFLLFVKHQVGIQAVPPLSPIDRDAVLKEANAHKVGETSADHQAKNSVNPSVTFTLKRSGKDMRMLSTAPPINLRDWKLPERPQILPSKRMRDNQKPSKLTSSQVWGECFYIFKPIIHLSSMFLCGRSSFKPWFLACALDVSSLCLMGDGQDLNKLERLELRRRALMLAMYLLRSPFYDRHTKQRLLVVLRALSDKVPGLSLILIPLMDYLPVWQRIYFYTWSS
uniref:Peroxisomal membrane protein PEX16 n=1 Tax=Arion vulgaris TaxID=1028688 RepID=A0A0B6ZD29_9EUPU